METKKHCSNESEEQTGFVRWFRNRYPGVLIFYINNGAAHIATGKRLKDMGAVAGIPDLSIPEWGVWVEMKRAGGVTSKEQHHIHNYLERIGNTVIVGYGAEDASRKILVWYKGTEPKNISIVEVEKA